MAFSPDFESEKIIKIFFVLNGGSIARTQEHYSSALKILMLFGISLTDLLLWLWTTAAATLTPAHFWTIGKYVVIVTELIKELDRSGFWKCHEKCCLLGGSVAYW